MKNSILVFLALSSSLFWIGCSSTASFSNQFYYRTYEGPNKGSNEVSSVAYNGNEMSDVINGDYNEYYMSYDFRGQYPLFRLVNHNSLEAIKDLVLNHESEYEDGWCYVEVIPGEYRVSIVTQGGNLDFSKEKDGYIVQYYNPSSVFYYDVVADGFNQEINDGVISKRSVVNYFFEAGKLYTPEKFSLTTRFSNIGLPEDGKLTIFKWEHGKWVKERVLKGDDKLFATLKRTNGNIAIPIKLIQDLK